MAECGIWATSLWSNMRNKGANISDHPMSYTSLLHITVVRLSATHTLHKIPRRGHMQAHTPVFMTSPAQSHPLAVMFLGTSQSLQMKKKKVEKERGTYMLDVVLRGHKRCDGLNMFRKHIVCQTSNFRFWIASSIPKTPDMKDIDLGQPV